MERPGRTSHWWPCERLLHTCKTSWARIYHLIPAKWAPLLLLLGWQSLHGTEQTLCYATMVDRLTSDVSVLGWWLVLRAVSMKGCSFQKAAWICFLKLARVMACNRRSSRGGSSFSRACWPVFLEDMTLTSEVTMAWAACRSFFRFMM